MHTVREKDKFHTIFKVSNCRPDQMLSRLNGLMQIIGLGQGDKHDMSPEKYTIYKSGNINLNLGNFWYVKTYYQYSVQDKVHFSYNIPTSRPITSTIY
jgi:hypothetical protein